MARIDRVTSWTNDDVLELVRSEIDPGIPAAGWIGSGQWSDCFAFRAGDRDLVVRIGRQQGDFQKDAFAARFRRPELPIPAVAKIGRHNDEWFAVSERVWGEPLETVASWQPLLDGVAELLDGLRAVDITATSGWGRWSATGMAPANTWREFLLAVDQDPPGHRTHGWKDRLASAPGAARAFEQGYEHLRAISLDDVPRSLVHNDLINRNTLVRDQTITGVFDWGNSIFGDHLYDLALFCFWQPWLPAIDDAALIAAHRLRLESEPGAAQNFDVRFEACLVHIALEHIAYHAFRGTWSEVELVTHRMDAVVNRRW